MAKIDHLAIPSRDPARGAAFLASLLDREARPDGPEGEFCAIDLDHGSFLLYGPAPGPFEPVHFALRVEQALFARAVERLQAGGIPYGNDPEGQENGEVSDPLGGRGRAYFRDPDGHLIELTC